MAWWRGGGGGGGGAQDGRVDGFFAQPSDTIFAVFLYLCSLLCSCPRYHSVGVRLRCLLSLLRLSLTSLSVPFVSHQSPFHFSLFTPRFLSFNLDHPALLHPFFLHLCVFSPSPRLKTSLSVGSISPQVTPSQKVDFCGDYIVSRSTLSPSPLIIGNSPVISPGSDLLIHASDGQSRTHTALLIEYNINRISHLMRCQTARIESHGVVLAAF